MMKTVRGPFPIAKTVNLTTAKEATSAKDLSTPNVHRSQNPDI